MKKIKQMKILILLPRELNRITFSKYGRRRIYQYKKDDFRFEFLISTKLSNSTVTRKHWSKEKLSSVHEQFLFIYLLTCYLKMLVRKKN